VPDFDVGAAVVAAGVSFLLSEPQDVAPKPNKRAHERADAVKRSFFIIYVPFNYR